MQRINVLDAFVNAIVNSEGRLTQFDDRLWQLTIEKATIGINGEKTCRFFNGTEIQILKMRREEISSPSRHFSIFR